MFGLAVAVWLLGYAMMYTSAVNLRNGGNGPTLLQALGIQSTVTLGDPTADKPNMTGQPATTQKLPFYDVTPL